MLYQGAEVTRSLSNLYKQRYVVPDGSGTRVINSNSRVAERMQELERLQMMNIPTQQGAVDGFVAGLKMEVVDAVPKEPEASPEEIRERAKEEAEALLSDARNQSDMLLANANREAELIREQAREKGFEAGQQEGNAKADAELARMRRQLEEEKRQMEQDYQQKLQELEA